MRRLGAWILPVAVIGLFAATRGSAEQQDYNYAYPQGWYYSPDSPEAISRAADAMSKVLNSIDSPQRRSMLAEQWIQFSRQMIAKSLAFREDWLNLQKQQTANQQEAQQLRVQMLRMEGEIEKLRAANLKLQNENLQLQMQLKPTTGTPTPAPAPPVQTPPVKK
jgi:hypothetical protein